MPDPADLISHWGYLAIFFFVFLGNLGLPVPEESVLVFAGFLVWKGDLQFLLTSVIGVVSAVSGDNLGYWIGHNYGTRIPSRYRRWLLLSPDSVSRMRGYILRYGVASVVIGRFLPGVRFLVGPLAGIAKMPFSRFFVANLFGALIYVPLMVTAGYAVSLGLADYLKRIEHLYGEFENIIGVVILSGALIIFAWRLLKAQKDLPKQND